MVCDSSAIIKFLVARPAQEVSAANHVPLRPGPCQFPPPPPPPSPGKEAVSSEEVQFVDCRMWFVVISPFLFFFLVVETYFTLHILS